MAFPRRLLTEGEEIILDLRPHWIALFRPALITLGALALIVFVSVQDLTRWLALAVVTAWIIFALPSVLVWKFTEFVLTNERVINRRGIIAKNAKEIPLETINDVSFHQSILGRVVKAGSLVIESAGESGQEPFTNIRNPERVQLEIYSAAESRKGLGRAPTPTGAGSVADELAKLADLRDRGVLTAAEFEARKQKLLGT